MKNRQVMALLLTIAMTANLTAVPGFASADSVSENASGSTESMAESGAEAAAGAITKVAGNGKTGSAQKSETVYVFTDANGNTKNVTVSDWLKNRNGDSKLTDSTTLSDVQNVTGDQTYTTNSDGTITWDADGSDIYYQGTTSKETPVDAKITYYLDGKEIDPKDLAGKSGKVKIRIQYTNKEKSGDVYVPFTAMTGIVLSNDSVSNVQIDNGTVVSEGKNTVVVGVGFPGLKDSLASVKDDMKDTADQFEEAAKNLKADSDADSTDSDSSAESTDSASSTDSTASTDSGASKSESGPDSNSAPEDTDRDDTSSSIEKIKDQIDEIDIPDSCEITMTPCPIWTRRWTICLTWATSWRTARRISPTGSGKRMTPCRISRTERRALPRASTSTRTAWIR